MRATSASTEPSLSAAGAARFERPQPIRFSHCDPAGIVFYPQYLILFNQLVEDWFNEALGVPYAAMIAERQVGLPLVRLGCDFRAVSRMGETVTLGLAVERVGSRSLALKLDCRGGGGELRVEANKVLVFTDLRTHRSQPIPADIRRALDAFAGAAPTP